MRQRNWPSKYLWERNRMNANRKLEIGTLALLASLMSAQASAQPIGGGIPHQTTLGHELFLVLVGAVLGGFLGPLFQVLDGWIGISPGVRQQKANYAVQREIAASLDALVRAQTVASADRRSTAPSGLDPTVVSPAVKSV
jgi:hypothetical protein